MKEIKLTNSKEVCLVDDEDFEQLNKFKWYLKKSSGNGRYVARSERIGYQVVTILIHRVVTDCPKGFEPHHKDNNTLNNRKENLEVCTHQKNINYRDARVSTG